MSIKELSYNKVISLSLIGNSLEVSLQHPLCVLKNHLQTHKCKFHYNFRNLYKGYFFNLYSINYISLIQYFGYNFLYKHTKNDIVSSLGSGFVSGLITSPSEFYIINKDHKDTLLNCIQKNNLRKIFKYGLYNCIIRESIYTSCLLTLTPFLEKKCKENGIKHKHIIAPVMGGTIATFLSHPFDTKKTIQQRSNNNSVQIPLKDYYKGITLRSFRMITTFFILNSVNNFFIKKIF